MSGFRDLEESVVGLTHSIFGQSVTYTPNAGTPVSINGVFDNLWVVADSHGMPTLKPTLRIALSDLVARPGKGDTVLISSQSYRVIESREDGYGGTTLILQKV